METGTAGNTPGDVGTRGASGSGSSVGGPAPGRAPMPAPDAAELLRANAADSDIADRPAVLFDEASWTHAEFFAESCRFARMLLATDRVGHRDDGGPDRPVHVPDRPVHVGVLLDNTPDYLFALGGAALAGATVVGLNHTRAGFQMWRDLTHTDVDVVITESAHLARLEGAFASGDSTDPAPPVVLSRRFDRATTHSSGSGILDAADLESVLGGVDPTDPGVSPGEDARWALVFTSGTSSDPKAVVCSQRRLLTTGNRMRMLLGLGPDDVGYICMPLFHSNALMVGWAPSLVAGCSVALARKFSASGWLPDVRRHGASYFNYTGKPLSYLLATPERADDADNTLRVAFGNEGSPQVLEDFATRFDVRVIDAFGSTEGAIAVSRDAPARRGAMGVAGETVMVVAPDGEPCPPARFDTTGRLLNAEECVGEIVNTAGAGPFEGYYNNEEATAAALRNGWYWSGDLGYLDDDRYLFFAGRTADWIRVDGENFPAGPIDEALSGHPDVVVAASYGVPDIHAGDQVMAAVVLAGSAQLDPAAFARWVEEDSGLPPKWRPRYLRVAAELPTTGTNKVVKRTLVHHKYRPDLCTGDALWELPRGGSSYVPFGEARAAATLAALTAAGRERFWDL